MKTITDLQELWKNYHAEYPQKYMETDNFDHLVENVIKRVSKSSELKDYHASVDALDIGGGRGLASYVQDRPYNVQMYLLDPYVEWNEAYAGTIELHKNDKKFDVIIARGCFGYLNDVAIQEIPKLLKRNGIFLANYFGPFKGVKVSVEYNALNENLVEIAYGASKAEIQHKVVNLDTDTCYEHDITIWSINEIKKMLPGFKITKYDTNSLLITKNVSNNLIAEFHPNPDADLIPKNKKRK